MVTKLKALALGGAVAAAATVAAAAPGGVAHAAVYNGACGSGYALLESARLGNLWAVFLAYNGGTGKHCVVTSADRPGPHTLICARVSVSGQPWIEDCRTSGSQAGPVYVSAAGQCIDWGGEIDGTTFSRFGVHCG